MNQVSNRVEEIFATAVAMDQSGKLRSTIYAIGHSIYIFNSDHTVLLRFLLRKTETPFAHPVSFRANDYDGRVFREEGGKIVFITETESYIRTKSCSTPEMAPEDIEKLFKSYKPLETNVIQIHNGLLSLLDDSLSHIEISGKDGGPVIVQRNVYSGALIDIRPAKGKGMLNLSSPSKLDEDFGPVGLRTPDFTALFSFVDILTFCFPPKKAKTDYCWVESEDPRVEMTGIISSCLYDELGEITEARKENTDGRKEQESRRRQP